MVLRVLHVLDAFPYLVFGASVNCHRRQARRPRLAMCRSETKLTPAPSLLPDFTLPVIFPCAIHACQSVRAICHLRARYHASRRQRLHAFNAKGKKVADMVLLKACTYRVDNAKGHMYNFRPLVRTSHAQRTLPAQVQRN